MHFCLNGQVESHAYGNWDTTKYAVCIPLKEVKDKIAGGTECDIFSQGGVNIDNSAYVLCPESEIEQIKQLNPQATVVGYRGDSVSPYVDIFISQALGYKQKEPTQNSRCWNSGFGHDHDTVYNIFQEQGWEYTNHTGSKWQTEEQRKQKTEMIIKTLKSIKENRILSNEENLPVILDYIKKMFECGDLMTGYSFMGDILSSAENLKTLVKNIKVETGINLSIVENDKSNFIGKPLPREEVQIDSYLGATDFNNEIYRVLGKECTRQLQFQEIFLKHKNGEQLTELESWMYKFETEYGGWYKSMREGVISEQFIEDIKRYSNINDKNISDLPAEELDFSLQFLNKKLQYLSSDISEKGQNFSVRNITEITPETCEIMRNAGMYVKPRKAGIKLFIRTRE